MTRLRAGTRDGTLARMRILPLALALAVCSPAVSAEPPVCGYTVQRVYPHDAGAYTQGLIFRDGQLIESTGQVGSSVIRRVTLDGRVLREVPIPPDLFGEGIVDWGREIVSVTWKGGAGFRWSIDELKPTGRFTYRGEGWGLTQDGRDIILSDGTATLRRMDPRTMRERGAIAVRDGDRPVTQLNELEWVRGEILANVWQTDRIARIDPKTGRVKAWIDLSGLGETAGGFGPDAVLNGIAYDPKGDRLFVTGKNWSKLFQIALRPGADGAACPAFGAKSG